MVGITNIDNGTNQSFMQARQREGRSGTQDNTITPACRHYSAKSIVSSQNKSNHDVFLTGLQTNRRAQFVVGGIVLLENSVKLTSVTRDYKYCG